jgi:hypothetical protein
MCDVFESHIWRDFQTFHGSSFLASPPNYGFMLNVDWSVVSRSNESSEECFKWQNIFLVVIPGPNEPRINIAINVPKNSEQVVLASRRIIPD